MQMIKVVSKNRLAPRGTSEAILIGPGAWNFKVGNNPAPPQYPWVNFVTALPGYNDKTYLFTPKSGVNYIVKNALKGQNNNNPLSMFSNHVVVEINGEYYDPSYGVVYQNIMAMQTKAIAGLFNITTLRGTRQMWIRMPGKAQEIEPKVISPDDIESSS